MITGATKATIAKATATAKAVGDAMRGARDRVCEALVGLEREAACFDRAAGD
jgi:hypothetical protein